ncbi:hypothetical protein A3K64_00615 [Candidatus Micrarchaeota archaeon RBG_16_36_9]|nr:MAG: hypothetical protein A3K64_00615 [Candidatus Micrarchaeota archaeon RBG_16_36_9]
MGLGTRFILMILIPIVILIGFTATFSLIGGQQNPLELFNKVDILTNNYLMIGVLILIIIVFFGFVMFLREKLLGSS